LTEDYLLDSRSNNYLAALVDVAGELGLAWLDVSTGDFMVEALESERLAAALGRVEPSELLLPDRLLGRPEAAAALAEWKHRLVPLPGARFDSENARRRLEALFKVGTMAAFGDFGRAELAAAGALVDYLDRSEEHTSELQSRE